MMAIGNGIGRISSGMQMFCPQHVMISNSAFAFASAVAVGFFPICNIQYEFMIVALAYGFTSGPLYGLASQTCANFVSEELLGLALAWTVTLDGAMSLIGSPLVAYIQMVELFYIDSSLYIVTGCLSVASLIFVIPPTFMNKRNYSALN